MLKSAYKVGCRGGAMVSTSAWNAGDPRFESRSWYDRFLYVNIHSLGSKHLCHIVFIEKISFVVYNTKLN